MRIRNIWIAATVFFAVIGDRADEVRAALGAAEEATTVTLVLLNR